MKYRVTTNNAPIRLEIKVKTSKPETLCVLVYDEKNPEGTVFTNRWKTINGEETFSVRLPLSPATAIVEVYNKALGRGIKRENETSFSIESVEKKALERKLAPSDIANADIRSFVDFACAVAYNLGTMEPDKAYQSDDGKFFIKLSGRMLDKQGNEVTTPARINRHTGVIQVSKKQMLKMTVPMRFAILMHEFSHYYLNEKIDDEMEADLNGLLIYLGLGFPRIEAYQAFLETFKNRPSELNKDRYDIINKFITDFENIGIVINK